MIYRLMSLINFLLVNKVVLSKKQATNLPWEYQLHLKLCSTSKEAFLQSRMAVVDGDKNGLLLNVH